MADPYRNFKYELVIDGMVRAGWHKVSGLKGTTAVTEYREGGDNDTKKKLVGQTSFENVTLTRGNSNESDIVDWRRLIFSLDGVNGNNPPAEGFRKRVTIYLKDKDGSRVKKWVLKRAWPCEDGDDDLDAMSDDVLMEEMVLCHEGMTKTNLASTGAGPFEDSI